MLRQKQGEAAINDADQSPTPAVTPKTPTELSMLDSPVLIGGGGDQSEVVHMMQCCYSPHLCTERPLPTMRGDHVRTTTLSLVRRTPCHLVRTLWVL